jgi:hypothetical protein
MSGRLWALAYFALSCLTFFFFLSISEERDKRKLLETELFICQQQISPPCESNNRLTAADAINALSSPLSPRAAEIANMTPEEYRELSKQLEAIDDE